MNDLDEFKFWASSALSAFPDGFMIFDHSNRSADEIAEDIIELAQRYGFYEYDLRTLQRKLGNRTDPDYSENIGYLMDEAIEYLSMNLPDGYWIGNDGYAGAFGIWKCEDD